MRLATGWRQAVRTRREVVARMSAAIKTALDARGFTAGALDDVSLTLPVEEFERLEWAMGHVKVRDPETAQWVRINLRFQREGMPRPNLMVKGCPVFCDASV